VNVRPHSFDLPLFLHVFGAMLLFGAVLTAVVAAWASFRSDAPVLRRAAFWALAAVAVPSFVLMRAGAGWIYSKEGFSGHNDPTWVGVGFGVADAGVIVLLAAIAVAFWWRRSGSGLAARLSAGVSSLYLLLLAVAWLAMSGKWG
jgi:hypothetical protein